MTISIDANDDDSDSEDDGNAAPPPPSTTAHLIMELMVSSLDHLLWKSGKDVSAEERLAGIIGVANGIAYLHSMGMAHRDIKPPNILIDATGSWKLGDFGLSDVRSTMSKSRGTVRGGAGKGTQGYMAPELYKGSGGRASDVYAFGVLFFEVATQTCAFEGCSDAAVLHAVLDEEDIRSVSPSDFKDNQQDFADLVNACWRHKPNERQKMLAVVLKINLIVRPISISPPSIPQLPLSLLSLPPLSFILQLSPSRLVLTH